MNSLPAPQHAWGLYLIFFGLNLVNLAVVMSVNIAYVNTLVDSTY